MISGNAVQYLQTQAAELNNTKSAQTKRRAAVAAKIQSEPEDGTVLSEVEPWQQSLSAQAVSVITIERALGGAGGD